jgi:hypothetical protein
MSGRSASVHHMEQLLDLLFHLMGQDMRRRVMSELPAAYNDYVGSDIVQVLRTHDGSILTPPSGSDRPAASRATESG